MVCVWEGLYQHHQPSGIVMLLGSHLSRDRAILGPSIIEHLWVSGPRDDEESEGKRPGGGGIKLT